jgi:ABC-type Fe3+ transport system substrate-binding protein
LGIEKARKLVEGLAKQKLILRNQPNQMAQLLAAGEFPMAQVYVHHLERVKSKGAPVDWIKTLDPLVALRGAVAISARAPHPNAARLFVDFYLSKEGQQLVKMWGKVPAHPDVDHLHPVTKSKDLRIHFLDARLTSENSRHYLEMAKIAFPG